MEHNNSTSLNILFNNNLASDSWNKRMSCEQCEPIKSPSDSRHDVVTLKSMSNKIFIFSYEDNAPLVDNKEYLFSIYVYVDTNDESEYSPLIEPSEPNPLYNEEYYLDRNINLESLASNTNITAESNLSTISVTSGLKKKKQKPIQMALFKGRYFNEHNILTDFRKVNDTDKWIKISWSFKIKNNNDRRSIGHIETIGTSNSQRVSFYIKNTENKIISLWKPALYCTSGIYDLEKYKNFDFFKSSINLFNEYKNTCVNIYSNQTKNPTAGFLMSSKYICSIYNKDHKEPIYAQIFPTGNIVPIKLIGIDPMINISLYELPESARIQSNFLVLETNNTIEKTLLICTLNRQYSTCKHQITPGFVTSELNKLSINDGLFQTTFEKEKTSVGQPVLNPNGELIGMVSEFSNNALCINVNLMHKICSRIIRAYEANPHNIPLELNGAFLGIKYHLSNAAEKDNLKIQEREGLIIDKIYPMSPAENVGLKEGDIIFNFSKNNTPVLLGPSFFEYIYAKKVDSTICLEYSKNYNIKEKIPIEVRLESRRKYTNVPSNFL